MNKARVAIVGRPNVGKSTLFNRMLGTRQAIVEDLPGTTRDRIRADVTWEGREFVVVDAGGLETEGRLAGLRQKIREQVERSIAEADLVLFLVDARDGLLPGDLDVADLLRRTEKPLILVANKVETAAQRRELHQFHELGLGEPETISAYHGKGIDDLLDTIVENLPPAVEEVPEPEAIKIAIVGRPNVGKSLLTNTLLGEERQIVHEIPGTTRDTVDSVLMYNGETITLIDTAGIRRRGKIEPGVEKYSWARTEQAIERADIGLLLIDAVEGLTSQDLHILGYIQKAHKGAILGVNKWDLAEYPDTTAWASLIRQKVKFMPYMEIVFVSAMTGYGVDSILTTAKRVYAQRQRRISDTALDRVFREALAAHPPPSRGHLRLKFFKAIQTDVNPPTFTFIVNRASLVHFTYRRYLENMLRKSFGFQGTAIRLVFKSKGEDDNKRKR